MLWLEVKSLSLVAGRPRLNNFVARNCQNFYNKNKRIVYSEDLDLLPSEEEKDSKLINELQNKLNQNHIDYSIIKELENQSKNSKAIELYQLYENASPEIRSAVELLLKANK